MLKRTNVNVQDVVSYVMCALGVDEDIGHLLFFYSFTSHYWHMLNTQWDGTEEPFSRVTHARTQQISAFTVLIAS